MQSISVIIITHNRLQYLPDALRGIECQTLRPQEIIIVDDGSKFKVEEEFSAQAAQLTSIPCRFVRIEDLGPSAARNAGAAIASGSLLAFLDDDDYWLGSYLEEAVTAIQRQKAGAVITQMDCLKGGAILPWKKLPEAFHKHEVLIKNLGVTGSNIIIKAETYRQLGGYDPELLASEDKDILYRLLDSGAGVAIQTNIGAIYRRFDDPKSQLSGMNVNPFMLKGKAAFLAKYERLLPTGERRHLTAQLAFLRYHKASGFAQKSSLLWIMLLNSPAFVLETLGKKSRPTL